MALDRQPTLDGTCVRLRPLTSDDHDALQLASGGALVVETLNGQVIGTSRYHNDDERDSSVEIGWTFLSRDYWGGPTNREIKTLVLDQAFRDVEGVYFYVAPDNHRSQRAVEKLGARRLSPSPRPGNVTFELTRRDWLAQP